MTVLSAIGSVALLLMLLYLPGAAAAAMLVRRPLSVLAAAPAAGYAMYSVGAMVTTAAGIRWTPVAVAGWLVICLVVVALGAVAAGVLDQRAPWARRTEGDDDVVAVSPVASGATSSRGAWWAAGAVVLQEVPEGATAVGVPAQIVRVNGEKVHRYADEVDQTSVENPTLEKLEALSQRVELLEKLLDEKFMEEKKERVKSGE